MSHRGGVRGRPLPLGGESAFPWVLSWGNLQETLLTKSSVQKVDAFTPFIVGGEERWKCLFDSLACV